METDINVLSNILKRNLNFKTYNLNIYNSNILFVLTSAFLNFTCLKQLADPCEPRSCW